MVGESPTPTQASTPAGAVFLSYASQDGEAAKRICEALAPRASKSGSIRASYAGVMPGMSRSARQVKECALFIPRLAEHRRTQRKATSGGSGIWQSSA